MKKHIIWAFTCLLIAVTLQSCTKLYKRINGTDLDQYRIAADYTNSNEDKQSIANYNFVIDLYDSLLVASTDSDQLRYMKWIDVAKNDAEVHDNEALKLKMQRNYQEINSILDNQNIPRELRDYKYYDIDWIVLNHTDGCVYLNFIGSNFNVDKDGRLFGKVRRDNQEIKEEVLSNVIRKNGRVVLHIIDNKPVQHKEGETTIQKDKVVDLNKFFKDPSTDYNATELSDVEEKMLDDAGIYYDYKTNKWRQRK